MPENRLKNHYNNGGLFMLIEGKLLAFGSDLSDVNAIRRNVFVEEMRLPEAIIFDSLDDFSMHVIVYEKAGSKNAVATGRISFDGTNCEISQLAVLKEHRAKKFGDFTVKMLLNRAFTSGIHQVECTAFSEIVPFFQTIGFHTIGNEMIENNRKCYKMLINETDIIKACQKGK